MALKKVTMEFTQKMCDEMNELQDKLFTKEQQEFLKMERYKPHVMEAWVG